MYGHTLVTKKLHIIDIAKYKLLKKIHNENPYNTKWEKNCRILSFNFDKKKGSFIMTNYILSKIIACSYINNLLITYH